MTTDPLKPPEARHGYVNVLNGLVRLVREEGLPGLTRGLIPNTVIFFVISLIERSYLTSSTCHQTRAILMNVSGVFQ